MPEIMCVDAVYRSFLVLTVLILRHAAASEDACSVQTHPDGVHVHCSSRHWHPERLRQIMSAERVVALDLSHSGMSQIPDLTRLNFSSLVSLDLSHNNVSQIASLASLDFSNLLSLNISHNAVSLVPARAFAGLTSLQTLRLDGNLLAQFHPETFSGLQRLQTLGLAQNRISVLSSNTFSGLQRLQTLDLTQNRISALSNNSFSGAPAMRSLSLGGNPIDRAEVHAFTGLVTLISLDLEDHKLTGKSSLPPGVFAPLVSLQSLRMHTEHVILDAGDERYPDHVFGDLVSLQYLSLYSFPRIHFGLDFAGLTSLSFLDLGDHCRIMHLHNDSFEGFHNSSSLNVLGVNNCRGLWKVEACAFCHLPKLRSLRFDTNHHLPAREATAALYGLRGQSLDEVLLHSVGFDLTYSTALDGSTSRYLPTMCIKHLDLRNSNLARIASRALYHTGAVRLAGCLEHFDVSDNRLLGDGGAMLTIVSRFHELRTFSIENQKSFSVVAVACRLGNTTNCNNHGDDPVREGFNWRVPVNLTYFNISACIRYYNTPPLHFNFTTAANLRTLDFGYGFMSPCLTTFHGLGGLHTLVLDGNYCDRISDTIFDHMPALRRLSLASLHLQGGIRSQRLLQYLPLLETLDVSRNYLVEMPGRSLPHQPHLKQLTAAFNSFQGLPLDFELHPNLTVLDLSYNSITSLNSSERDSLDSLAHRHGLRLSLKGNPLLCACANLDFIRWLWHTPVLLDGEGIRTRRFTCTAETGEITDTERVMMDIDFQWRKCIGPQAFGLALSGFFLQLLALVTVYLLWRSWTYVLYCWLTVKRLKLPRRQDFEKDVYVVYADEDAELAIQQLPRCLGPHGVRLLLRDLHDVFGSVRADNVVINIEKCWKVLLVVTESFSRDQWSCGFSVHQAQRAVTDTRPDRVIVLFLHAPRRLQPMLSLDLLLRFLPETCVFHAHPDTPRHPDHPVWGRLTESIVTSQPQ